MFQISLTKILVAYLVIILVMLFGVWIIMAHRDTLDWDQCVKILSYIQMQLATYDMKDHSVVTFDSYKISVDMLFMIILIILRCLFKTMMSA